MKRTLHIFLDSPTRPLVAGDARVVDHRVDRSSGEIAGDVIDTDVRERRHHDAARDAYLEWIATVGDRELTCGETLKTLLAYRDELSLWWFLPMQVKHYVLHELPRLFQQILWLQQDSADSALSNALDGADAVTVHATSKRSGELFAAALRGHVPAARCEIQVLDPDGEPHEPSSRTDRARSRLKALAQPFIQPVAAHGFGLLRSFGESPRTEEIANCDVALVVSSDEWFDVDGVPQHRYLTDVPKRLADAGLRVAWLPLLTGVDEWSDFVEVLGGRDEPTLWPSTAALKESSNVSVDGIGTVRQRFRDNRESLLGDPALFWNDVDLSEWIASEIDQFLQTRVYFWMQAYELLKRQIEEAGPAVVLYRNEFYSLQRVVGAACARAGVSGWSYQHGAVPRTHWVYQHDGRDVRDDADLVRGFPAPQQFLAYSEFVADLVTAKSYPRERVTVLGSLRHDASFERSARDDRSNSGDDAVRRASVGLPTDRPSFVICSQLKPTIPAWIELLVRGLRIAEVDAHIVLKPHWNHRDIAAAHATFEKLGWDDYQIYEGELDPMLESADCSLTGTSTTAIEAAIVGTPVICISTPGEWEPMPYVEDGLAIGATDPESMAEAIERVLSDAFVQEWPERREQFLRRHMNNITEPAVDALIRMILSER